ncbi:essential nuclear protein 1, putative [Plasmodium vinckei vinckei]|uniref:Essential nuclear protein 1, putative n=1 Tax=Plasmodium vinckei vinckei TaxID=54757 RepID=A0A449BS70_PLAVN|nr:essential nuclear protein 1, putative [Plasmodium vinckei vinckei]VEV56275.1 essential nuclear protein 1, putative [Plasmodium vinckei vinckei]
MAKIKVRKKQKHTGTFEENLKNVVVSKNGILKKQKKKKKKLIEKHKKKNTLNKIIKLANITNENDYSDYDDDDLIDFNNSQEDKFLEFNDDIDDEVIDDTNFYDGNEINSNQNYMTNGYEEPNDILEDLNIKINKNGYKGQGQFGDFPNNKMTDFDKPPEQKTKIDSMVEKCYRVVGENLAIYKKGKLHQALTILVKSPKWYELLLLTSPKKWTTQAVFEVTKLFSSGLKEKDVCIYYRHILLPIILENIELNKKLDGFLYKTLIKSLYKSKAWFKGLLYPVLLQDSTKKQIIIFGSVIQKMSISINVVTCCLNDIFKFPWNAHISHILTIFFNKKYAFSKEFIEKSVDYFLMFENYPNTLTINWHKSLLTLIQNYRGLINDEQIGKLKILLKKKNHHQITNEILKHIYSPSCFINQISNLNMDTGINA